MAASVRGSNSFAVPTGSGNQTITLPVTTNAGDVIIVATSGGGVTSFSMSGGSTTTWSIPGNNVGVAPTVWTMLGYNVPAGVTSATLSYTITGAGSGACAVISGLISGNPVIQSGNGSSSASTSATASIPTAVKPSNFLFYATSHFGATSESGNWSADLVNFTQLQFSNSNSRPVGIDYKYPAALGILGNQAQVTYNNSNNGGLTVLELGVIPPSGSNLTMLGVG